jgi:hypothetical protein
VALAGTNKHFIKGEILVLGQGHEIVLLIGMHAARRLRGLHRDDARLKRRLRPSVALIRRLLQDDTVQIGLRRAWHDLGMRGSEHSVKADLLGQRLVEAIEADHVLAIALSRSTYGAPDSIDETALKARVRSVEGPPTARVVGGNDVSAWSKSQKVEDMLRRLLDRAVENLGPGMAQTLKSMLTPQPLLTVAGSFVILAALHAIGVGEVVDTGLTFYAWWTGGTAGLAALADLLGAIIHTIDARSSKDLDDAARLFAGAVAVLGVAILTLVMARAGRKSPAGNQIRETVADDVSGETSVQRGIARDTTPGDAKQTAAMEAFEAKRVPASAGTGAKFGSDAKLQDHFARHGGDFGAATATEYQGQADAFLTGPKPSGALEKIRPNGDIVRYNPVTDEFGVASPTAIRTYYKPDPAVHGYPTNLDYFNAQ